MTNDEHVASTRAVYDYSAAQYASAVGTNVTPKFERPLDRALLDAFADDVMSDATLPVLDIGCGVGRVTSYLHARGVKMQGVDLSPQMIGFARSAHPHIAFDVGSMTELPFADKSFGGVVLWYSIIHTPPRALGAVWNEVAGILTPSAPILVGFQSGSNETVEAANAYGSAATLTWFRHAGDDVARSLEAAGFAIRTHLWRAAELAHETTPQTFFIARRQ